jgi:pyruvate/2-oxoglutarate dehydrogenase complex dihydrolipoamide acyltransferase (E2) component
MGLGLFGLGAAKTIEERMAEKIALAKTKTQARTQDPRWERFTPDHDSQRIRHFERHPPRLSGLGMFGLGEVGAATFEEKLAKAQAKAAAKKAKADAKVAAAAAKAAAKAEKAKVKASGGILSPETPVDYANIQAAVVADEQAQMQQVAAAQAQQQAQTSQWMTYGAYALVAVGGFLAVRWYLGRKKN